MRALTNVTATKQWNRSFTDILREKDRTVWGNWTLNPMVIAGAIGIIDPKSGDFTCLGNLPRAELLSLEGGESWCAASAGVWRTASQVDFQRGYIDPSTGQMVGVGTRVTWSFPQENFLSSNGHVTGRTIVDGYADLIRGQFEWLYELAKKTGFATPNGIVQGFGVVTQTLDCCGAINLGSLDSYSEFQLLGSVDGVAAMTGSGTVRAGIKGSYKEVMSNKHFELHLFPGEANATAARSIAISYNFASFDNRLLVPHWAGPSSL